MPTPIEPVVQLFDGTSGIEYDNVTNIINFGEVKAGDKSDVKTLHLWNNKGGVTVASTMRDVELFALDSNEAKVEDIVKNGWLHVKCTSAAAPAVERLYDLNVVKITALGQTEGEILGAVNDGTDTNTGNFAAMELYAQLIEDFLTATHGEKPFHLAFRYFFT